MVMKSALGVVEQWRSEALGGYNVCERLLGVR